MSQPLATLLHLTDLHFAPPDTKGCFWNSEAPELERPPHDRRGLLGSLIYDHEKQDLIPNLVVVTGDLLDRANPGGSDLAVQFLSDLAEKLKLDRGRIVILPGNHDLRREADQKDCYLDFDAIYRELYGALRPAFGPDTLPHHRVGYFEHAELGLEVVAFNSCEQLDSDNEHGSIGVAQREQAELLLRASEEKNLFRIAAMHHHLEPPPGVIRRDSSVMDDAGTLRHWLVEHRFRLVLHGHQHVDYPDVRLAGDWFLAIVGGGSAGVGSYGRRSWESRLSYQVILIDSPTSGRRIRREYSPQYQRWNDTGQDRAARKLRFGPADNPLPLEICLAEMEHASRSLLSFQQNLCTGEWLERPELTTIVESIQRERQKPIVLLGVPGSGKSAVLAHLAATLKAQGDAVLAIRADQLVRGVESIADLQQWLSFSSNPVEVLSAVARCKRTVLIIDQLDALCDLVDAHTQRLDILLRLVADMHGIVGLGIVLSCRDFEFRHDRRFQLLKAGQVKLELPPLNEVEGILRKHGIEPKALRPVFTESLRVPQHLTTFLKLTKDKERVLTFDTYQQMLEELWQRNVISSEDDGRRREGLLLDIAAYMAEAEELTAPFARFGEYKRHLDQLEAVGILRREEARRIGFTHQTWFGFTRARAFLTGAEQVSDYIRKRGGSLFVRATLWSALVNLREADPARYRRELHTLWTMPNLRPHLRALVLEFLGQLDHPRDEEVAIMLPILGNQGFLLRAALRAMAGSPGWFRLIVDRHLPSLMTRPHRRETWAILVNALPFAEGRVLDLLEKYWVHDPECWELALGVLLQLKNWHNRAINIVLLMVPQDGDSAGHYRLQLGMLVHAIATSYPELALRVVRAVLDQDLQQCRKTLHDAAEHHGFAHPFRRLVETNHGFDDLIGLSEQVPGAYLDAIWPWLIDVLDEIADPENPALCSYRFDHMIDRRRRKDVGPIDETAESIAIAVERLARQDAERFCSFVAQWESTNLLSVHRLLAAGLKEVGLKRTRDALEYLLGDPRRLNLQGYDGPPDAACDLIEALAPVLPLEEERRLEHAIHRSFRYSEDANTDNSKWRFHRQKYNRVHRLQLLRALQISPHLSMHATSRIQAESLALEEYNDGEPSSHRFRVIESPMRASHMLKAKDDDILNFFSELPDSTEWQHPRRLMQGGSIQASRELAEFAKTEPERALSIIARFEPGTHQRPVAYVMEALAETYKQRAVEEFEECIFNFEARGFGSKEYRERMAWAMHKLATRGDGLSDRLCKLLQGWLEDTTAEETEAERRREPSGQPHSILWGWGFGGALPSGNFPALHALRSGYVQRKPSSFEQFMDVIEAHSERPEQAKVWRALLGYLNYRCRNQRSQRFVEKLFSKYPAVRDCRDGAGVVAQMCWWADGTTLQGWLHSIRDSCWVDGAQAYGELLMLLSVRRPEMTWVDEEIGAVLFSNTSTDYGIGRIRLGLAFAAARLWSEPEDRTACTNVLLRLVPLASVEVAKVIMDLFHRSALPAGPDTNRLLDGLLENRSVLAAGDPTYLVARLKEMCVEDPPRVLSLCNALVDDLQEGDNAHRLSRANDDLIDISLTLQRLPDHQQEGLDLFERLLMLDFYGIRDVLQDIDDQPKQSIVTRVKV